MAIAAPIRSLSKLAQSLALGEGEGGQGGPPAADANAQQPNISPPPPPNLPPDPTTDLTQAGAAANPEGPAPLGTDAANPPTALPKSPADILMPLPESTKAQLQKLEPTESTAPAIAGALRDQGNGQATVKPAADPDIEMVKPAAAQDPDVEMVKPAAQTAQPHKDDPDVEMVKPAAQPAAPQPAASQQAAPMPSGTGAGALQGSPATIPIPTPESTEAPDPHSQIENLIAQGKSPGEAQAIASGQQPKTLAGNAPQPKPQVQQPAPQSSPAPEAQPPTPVNTLQAGKNNAVDPVALYRYLLGKFSNSSLVGYVPPDGARWGIKTGSAAEWAAFGLAVAKQESDLNTRSYNATDPGGSAGLFQFGQRQTAYTNGTDQFNPQASADAFVRSVQHFLANKGSVANMGETFGSIRRPNEAGQYIAGAQKVAAGGNGKDLVSSGGGQSGGPQKGGPPATPGGGGALASQPMFSIPTGSGGSAQPPPPQGPSFEGGGGSGRGPSEEAPQSGGSIGFYPGVFGGGGGGQAAAKPAAQASPPETEPEDSPLVAALMKRGFTQQQAQQFAQSSQNVAPGKGVDPYQRPQPPAPGQQQVPPPVTPKLLSAKQLMPTIKIPSIVPKKQLGPPPAAPGARPQLPAAQQPSPTPQAPKPQQQPAAQPQQTSQPPATRTPPSAPGKAPAPQPPPQPSREPTAFGRPPGSTHGDPNPPGMEDLTGNLDQMKKQHAALLSPDDPRVRRQADGYIKGEHFVPGDQFHARLIGGLPEGAQGRQRQLLSEAEEAIAEKRPMHVSYLSAPKEAEKFPTRDSRKFQYDQHSPEARLMGTTEGQLVGHSLIPLSVGVKLGKGGEPHQSYIQGISTNVMANNFQHLNDKLTAMGRESPYKTMGAKFTNDLEGYLHNLNAGHTATGRGYAIGTDTHPNEPDREHVPYKLTRKEADFINAVINNTGAFAKHEDAQAIRELAKANGTLVSEKGETNRMLHDIEQQDPGWSGRGSGKQGRVLEPSVRTFKTGLIMAHHRKEEHLGEAIRPGKEYQNLTKAVARTSEQGRPDVPIAASLHHTFADNRKINEIERDFSDHKISELEARARLKDLGEDPGDYRFVGGSGGLITPYEDDPEALTPEEHTAMKDNLRKQWVGGKLGVEDYRKKAAEVPLPSKPSQPKLVATAEPGEPAETPEEAPAPKPIVPVKPKPKPPKPQPVDTEPAETPETAPAAPSGPVQAPKPKPKPKAPQEPLVEPEEAPAKPPAPDEPLPPVKAVKPAAVKPPVAPAKLEKLVKPKDANKEWKGVPEAEKQAYLEEKVKRTMANQIRDKATHKLEVQRNEDGSVKYDPNGSPVYVQHDYDIANSPMLKKKALGQIKNADKHEDTLGNLIGPDGKEVIDPETGKPVLKHSHLNQTERRRLSAMHAASAVHTMGDKIFDSYNEAIKNPDIAAGEGWYSRMRKKLGDALGEHHELFAQLLGATSAKTPVRTNFINALDAFEQYKEGKFSKHIEKFLEAHGKLQEGEGALTQHMRDQGILKPEDPDHESDADAMAHWIRHHEILPKSKIGNKYSANSNAVLKVLAGTWLKEVGAPKTPNFAGNLTGRTLEATIDVWAARHLQRLGYEGHMKGPWRAQSAAEPGVSNIDFAFSQDAMRHAAEKISKATGKQMNPDDLQAILWFAEKHHYEERGWTRGQGAEKSSFDDVADRVFGKDGQPHDRPMDSTQLRAHYQAEAKALSQRKGKIKTAKGYLGTENEQKKLPDYMAKHGLTHEEVHGAEAEDEDEEAA